MFRWTTIVWFLCALLAPTAVQGALPGQLDPSFAYGGRQSVTLGPPGGADRAQALVRASNGALFMAGAVHFDTTWAIGLAKFDFDGYPSADFGAGNGRVIHVPPELGGVQVSSVALQVDGRIVVAGAGELGGAKAPLVCRFAVDGSIDITFGQNGCAVLALPETSGGAQAVVVQHDGRIAIAGAYQHFATGISRAFIAQLDASGKPANVGTGGIVFDPRSALGFSTGFDALRQTADGGLVAAGHIRHVDDYDFMIMKLDQAGDLAAEFGVAGVREYAFDLGPMDRATALGELPDGSLLVAGFLTYHVLPGRAVGLVKLTELGDVHPLFAPRLYDPCAGQCDVRATSMAVLADGRIVIAGSINDEFAAQDNDFFAWRLLPDGSQDAQFGQGAGDAAGLAWFGFGADNVKTEDVATGVVLQGERVVLGGQCRENGGVGIDFCLARLDHGRDETYTVVVQAGSGGTVFPHVQQSVAHSGHAAFGIGAEPGLTAQVTTGCGGGWMGEYFVAGPVLADCEVNVAFVPSIFHLLTYTASVGGTVNGATPQSVLQGSDGSVVTAVPEIGHHFVQWSDGSLANPRQDTAVSDDIEVVAHFAANLHAVTMEVSAGGSVTPDGVQWVSHGSTAKFLVKPSPGFAIESAFGCGGSLLANLYTTQSVTSDCAIGIEFEPSDAMYELTYGTNGNGSVTGDLQQTIITGGTGTPVMAVPAVGFAFDAWSDGMTGNPRQDASVVADVAVVAHFKAVSNEIFLDHFEE